jgi:hypothetical protein
MGRNRRISGSETKPDEDPRERELRAMAVANGFVEHKSHLRPISLTGQQLRSRRCLRFHRGYYEGCGPVRHILYFNTGTCISTVPEKIPFKAASGGTLFERATVVQRGLDLGDMERLLKDPFESVYQFAERRQAENPSGYLAPLEEGLAAARPIQSSSSRLLPPVPRS